MPFVAITKPTTGDPTKKSLIDLVIDNLGFINQQSSTGSKGQQISNGSFEIDSDSDGDPDNFTITDFTGGTHALITTDHIHGAQCLEFTSTVLANGGGEAVGDDFIEIGEAKEVAAEVYIKADVINQSARAEIVWYNNAQSLVSASNIADLTNVPTTWTLYSLSIAAPTNARYYKIRLTGGVPGAGSATGKTRFDGAKAQDIAYVSITGSHIENASIRQGHLNTSLQDSTGFGSGNHVFTYTGGQYHLMASLTSSGGYQPVSTRNIDTPNAIAFTGTTGGTHRFRSRYINASPPWDMGDGEIPLFIFLEIQPDGTIVKTDVTEAPPWAYNGPTSIVSDKIVNGKKYKRVRSIIAEHGTIENAHNVGISWRDIVLRLSTDPYEDQEITQAVKNADMRLIPSPFGEKDNPANTHVLLDPVSSLMEGLCEIHRADIHVDELIRSGDIIIGSTQLKRATPPGVTVVSIRWR